MTNTMEKSSFASRRHDESEFNLKEWALKARISRENTHSRRFSASNIKSFREDATSFRSNITISSTASSPGCIAREEIDPATYSFTTALKALQAKTVYTWEYLPTDGLILNSKWNDAEKYISNPLSGEVPLECLSAKTLSGRSFRSLTSRITMSAPLIYPSNLQQFHANSPISELENEVKIITIQEKKRCSTRDVGTQSTPADLSSSSPSPAPTPSIKERSIKHSEAEGGDSSVCCSEKLKSEKTVEVKETIEKQYTKRNETAAGESKKIRKQIMCISCRCSSSSSSSLKSASASASGGCLSILSFKGLWIRTRQKDKQKPRNSNNHSTFLYHISGC